MSGKVRWAVAVMMVSAAFMTGGCQNWRARRARRARERSGEVGRIHEADLRFEDDVPMGDERPMFETEVREAFETVYFGLDSSQVAPAERAKVERVADYLRRHRNVSLVIEGHCCERGSAEYNLALGERRALAVRAYLVGLGIEPERVQTVSYGEERPAVLGQGESILRQNRRVEFVLVR